MAKSYVAFPPRGLASPPGGNPGSATGFKLPSTLRLLNLTAHENRRSHVVANCGRGGCGGTQPHSIPVRIGQEKRTS